MQLHHIRNHDADQPHGGGSWIPAPATDSIGPRKQRIDRAAAITAFTDYVGAVNRGEFSQAVNHYHALRELGVHVLYQRPQAAGSTT